MLTHKKLINHSGYPYIRCDLIGKHKQHHKIDSFLLFYIPNLKSFKYNTSYFKKILDYYYTKRAKFYVF